MCVEEEGVTMNVYRHWNVLVSDYYLEIRPVMHSLTKCLWDVSLVL